MKKSALLIIESVVKQNGGRTLVLAARRHYSSNNLNSKYLTGVFPSISTPFERLKNEPVSWHSLEKNLTSLLKTPFSGFAVHGFYGEYPYLTFDERYQIVKVVRNIVGDDKTIIAGSSSESLKKTIDICETMKNCGANYSLLFTPHYYKKHMSYSALFEYFTKVADKSPLPIILHNVPSITFIDLPVELCLDLSEHPNIVALKECSHNIAKIAFICEHVKQKNTDFTVLTGSSSFLLDALRVGAVGCISAVSNILGPELIKLIELYKQSQTDPGAETKRSSNGKYLEEAYILQNKLVAPDLALSEVYGVAGLKACLDAYGFYGGPCRMPLMPLNQEEVLDLKSTFEQNGFYWPKPESQVADAARASTSADDSKLSYNFST